MTDGASGILPAAVWMQRHDGVVLLRPGSRISCTPSLLPAARWWRRVLDEAFALDVELVSSDAAEILFRDDGDLPAGGYAVDTVAPDPGRCRNGPRLVVRCADLPGAHAAVQTLRQLAGAAAFRRAPVNNAPGSAEDPGAVVALPAVTITDHPRFAWRGVLLDVARRFLPKHDVLRFVDLAATHKLNVVQLHLTDDQGWRFEVRRYPELTRTGAWRAESTVGTWRTGTPDGTPHGGFYTQDDLREIVAYARARGVQIVPEIDVPGHVEAALAAYPFLGTRKERRGVRTTWGISEDVLDPSDEALSFFRHVLDEVADVFDTPWIHLGGDEVPTDRWESSPTIRARAEALGFVRPRDDDGRGRPPEEPAVAGSDADDARRAIRPDGAGRVVRPDDAGRAIEPDDAHHAVTPNDGRAIQSDDAGRAAAPNDAGRAAASDDARRAGEPDVARLHGWFVARLADHVRGLGRRAVVWDEAFGPDLPADVVVMAWRSGSPGVAARALAAGHDVVVAPEHAYYLDHRASDRPDEPVPVGFVRTLEDVLAYDPDEDAASAGRRASDPDGQVGTGPRRARGAGAGRLLGGQAQVWTEHLDSARRIDYATFPRLAAVAETLWSPRADRAPGSPSSAEFLDRLATHHLPRLDAYGVEYRPPDGPRPWQRRPGVPGAPRDLVGRLSREVGPMASSRLPGGPAARTSGRPLDKAPTTPAHLDPRGVAVVRGVRIPQPGGELSPPRDLRISAGRIIAVEPARAASGIDGCVLDGAGRVALPGLIDAHSHAEGAVFDPDVQHALLRQGVTTVVTGQDGVSYAPGDGRWAGEYFAGILGEHPGYRGPRVRELLATYDGVVPVHVAYLAPHGTIRHEVLGGNPKRATLKELARMSRLLRQALDDGACGLSTGLEYLPGGYADERELVTLATVVAKRGLPHVSHMRGYEDKAGDAFAELVRVARASGAATHVSHYHGPAGELAGYVDEARADGLDVTFDSYPYLRGCSILAMVALPGWLPLADPGATLAALGDDDVVARLRREHFGDLAAFWPRVTFASVPARTGRRNLTWAEGRTLPDVARLLGLDPAAAVVEVLTATELRATCVFEQPPTNSAESVRALANHPAHLGGSDAIYLGGRPHPRGWGAFAALLAERVGSGDWSWHDAAEHLSGRAARRFGFAGRGALTAGSAADVVLADPDTIRARATYALPRVVAAGIDDVLVAGVQVLRAGALTGATPGGPLRPSGR
ncbi:family 20 glycosylhydrolase [Myceligenerans crystallogenes]|uniref:family 20 glycosylhydrolase n=1 Tax=Myceligenerans crystallogenes TaxID=316335 RepID=UPI0031CF47D6